MKKAAATNKTTTAEEDVKQYMAALDAKRQFLGATMGMSWRLAITVVVPIVAGVQLDKRFDTAPSWTLTGFFIAVFGACIAVWDTLRDLNTMQAEEDKESNKRDT